jgi:hypothetical protein
MERQDANAYPLVNLKTGGFDHKDPRIGRVNTPSFAVVGRVPKEGVAKPDTAVKSNDLFGDDVPF